MNDFVEDLLTFGMLSLLPVGAELELDIEEDVDLFLLYGPRGLPDPLPDAGLVLLAWFEPSFFGLPLPGPPIFFFSKSVSVFPVLGNLYEFR